MIHSRNAVDAMSKLYVLPIPEFNKERWATEFFGPRVSRSHAPGPQAVMSDMAPNEIIKPHFHGTAQFQLFPAGSGTLGRNEKPIQSLMVQFKDHHTAYGPIVAGANGLTFMSLRVFTGNSAPVYLHQPDFKEHLRPSKRRNLLSPQLQLSTPSVMRFRKEASWESIFDPASINDEMNAQLLRLGAGQTSAGPDPKRAGGYYVFVANGSMNKDSEELPLWSMTVVEPNEEEFEIKAGDKGLEALVLEFPLDFE